MDTIGLSVLTGDVVEGHANKSSDTVASYTWLIRVATSTGGTREEWVVARGDLARWAAATDPAEASRLVVVGSLSSRDVTNEDGTQTVQYFTQAHHVGIDQAAAWIEDHHG